MKLLLPLIILINAVGCAANGTAPANDYCLIAQPIYMSEQDALTIETESAIIIHNETWEKLCKN